MNKASNYTTGAVTVTTSETQLVALNDSRTALTFYNQGSAAAKIYTDTAANFIPLASGATMTFDARSVPMNEFNAITESGTAIIAVWEA